MTDLSDANIERVLNAAPFADNDAGIPEMCEVIRGLQAENKRLRAFAAAVSEEEVARMREALAPSQLFYEMADDNCPSCGAVPAIMWRSGGAFQQRTECICGRKTRWVACGHDAVASPSDAEVEEAHD